MSPRIPRIVLYSHDAMGLGHIRRNLLLAQSLASGDPGATVLLIVGSTEGCSWQLPGGTEYLALPAIRKEPDGTYRSRRLAVEYASLIAIRKRILSAALDAFNPDLVVVDKIPGGIAGELRPAIELLGRRRHTKWVLGLRDILDAPDQVRAEWDAQGNWDLVQSEYDAVWVYGDPQVCDPVTEYGFGSDIAAKVHHTGYLDPSVRRATRPDETSRWLDHAVPSGPLALCMVGGGQDGFAVALAFSQAQYADGETGLIVAGPDLPGAEYEVLAEAARVKRDLEVVRFVPDPNLLLRRAQHVVAMGGYNTVTEILSAKRRALIIPRVHPRTEQRIRAERLAHLGVLDYLHPDQVTPGAISTWFAQKGPPQVDARSVLDFHGLTRVRLLARALLSKTRHVRRTVTRPQILAKVS